MTLSFKILNFTFNFKILSLYSEFDQIGILVSKNRYNKELWFFLLSLQLSVYMLLLFSLWIDINIPKHILN